MHKNNNKYDIEELIDIEKLYDIVHLKIYIPFKMDSMRFWEDEN